MARFIDRTIFFYTITKSKVVGASNNCEGRTPAVEPKPPLSSKQSWVRKVGVVPLGLLAVMFMLAYCVSHINSTITPQIDDGDVEDGFLLEQRGFRTEVSRTSLIAPMEKGALLAPLRIRIAVIDGKANAIPGADVWLQSKTSDSPTLIGQGVTGSNGIATIAVTREFELPNSAGVAVSARATGFTQAFADAKMSVFDDLFTLQLGKGFGVSGWLVNPGGVPIKSVVVRATNHNRLSNLAFSSVQIMEDAERFVQLKPKYSRNQSVTDASGWFQIEGLTREEHFLIIDNASYIIDPVVRVDIPTHEGEFVAKNADSVTLNVFDANTGSGILNYEATVSVLSDGNTLAMYKATSSKGVLWMKWVRPSLQGQALSVQIEANGFVNSKIHIDPWDGAHRLVEAKLIPMQSVTYYVKCYWAPNDLCTEQVTVKVRSAGQSPIKSARILPNKDGVYELRVPQGRWDVEVRPTSVTVPGLAGSIAVDSSLPSRLEHIEFPPSGSVSVECPEEYLGGWLEIKGDSTTLMFPVKRKDSVHRLPPGKWVIKCTKRDMETPAQIAQTTPGSRHSLIL